MRKMTPSQYAAYLRQQQSRFNQEVRRYNQEVDRVNRANRAAAEKAVRDYNREVDRVNRHNQRVVDERNRQVRRYNQNAAAAVQKYNQAVRTHNTQVDRDRRQRIAALRSSSSNRYVEVLHSTVDLSQRFEAVQGAPTSASYPDLVALSEREASNSAAVAEVLAAEEPKAEEAAGADPSSDQNGVLDYLAGFSQDLCDRWRGALFSLNPSNPDASRHFCTSSREIFTEILEQAAPNEEVVSEQPDCERVSGQDIPSRRSKLRYLLRRKGADTPEMLDFVDNDLDDVLQLFRVFNEATHGSAGKHGFTKLQAIRKRVEGGIMFLAAIAH